MGDEERLRNALELMVLACEPRESTSFALRSACNHARSVLGWKEPARDRSEPPPQQSKE